MENPSSTPTPEASNASTIPPNLSAFQLFLVIGSILITAVVAGGLGYIFGSQSQSPSHPFLPPSLQPEPVACTLDARMCPDGTAVGRSGPNCEFSPCPGESGQPSN